jgi:hypothetical protein
MSSNKNKELKRKYKEKIQREKEIKKNPNACFCDKSEADESNYIGETEKIYYSKYDFNKKRPFSLPIYKCINCEKLITMQVAEA